MPDLNLDELKRLVEWYSQGYTSFANQLADAAPSLIAEVEQWKENHKRAVDNWTLDLQILKELEDEIHNAKARVNTLTIENEKLIAEVERLRAENEEFKQQLVGQKLLAEAKLQGHHVSPGSGILFEV